MSETTVYTGETIEATVCETSYGFVVTVRYIGSAALLGTKPFRNLADAIAYAELLTKGLLVDGHLPAVEYWRKSAAYFGEMAILFSHSRLGERVALFDAKQPSACGPYLAYVNARRAARMAFFAVPELREYPKIFGEHNEPGADRNTLCECGHVLADHVARNTSAYHGSGKLTIGDRREWFVLDTTGYFVTSGSLPQAAEHARCNGHVQFGRRAHLWESLSYDSSVGNPAATQADVPPTTL